MKRRTAYWLAGGAAAAVGAVALAGSGSRNAGVTGLPTTARLRYRLPPPSEPVDPAFLRLGPGEILFDGSRVPRNAPLALLRAVSLEYHATMAQRRRSLPRGADPVNTDAYSKELYYGPAWLVMIQPAKLTDYDLKTAVNGTPVDEFGRTAPGNYGNGPTSLWGQTFGGLLKNPLFRTVAIAALVSSGPAGIAAYGAYTMWEARGKNLTVKNVALVAARSYAVSQCGEGCGKAFDFGVGAASGKSVSRSAEDALLSSLEPNERVAFAEGKKLVRK